MKAYTSLQSFGLPYPPSRSQSIIHSSRIELRLHRKILVSQAKSSADSEINGSLSLRFMPPSLLAAEKEEAKAVLSLFFKKQGLRNAAATRTIKKSDTFIDHLVSHLQSVYKSRYLVGRELTTLEIRDALIPYLETLHEEYGSVLVDVVESFPDPPPPRPPPVDRKTASEKVLPPAENSIPVSTSSVSSTAAGTRKPKRAELPPSPRIAYLLELGMDLEGIEEIIRKFPSFAYYSLEGKIKPVVEFLLDLGVPRDDIPMILTKRPQLCGISLSENLIPTMAFLEELGVDRKQWAKVIRRFPPLLTYSRAKLSATVGFLRETGLSGEQVGKVLTRSPNIVSYSIEEKLRPTADYLRSVGADVGAVLGRSPQTFGLSVEENLKPVTEFLYGEGFSQEEVATMISRFGGLYTFSLGDNLMVKWEFFVGMGVYGKGEVVKFPQYFGYSLEERIKPRFGRMMESGVVVLLNQMLSLSLRDFETLLIKKKTKKKTTHEQNL